MTCANGTKSPRREPGDTGWHAFPSAMRCGFEPGNCVSSSGMDGGVVFTPGVPGFPPGAFCACQAWRAGLIPSGRRPAKRTAARGRGFACSMLPVSTRGFLGPVTGPIACVRVVKTRFAAGSLQRRTFVELLRATPKAASRWNADGLPWSDAGSLIRRFGLPGSGAGLARPRLPAAENVPAGPIHEQVTNTGLNLLEVSGDCRAEPV